MTSGSGSSGSPGSSGGSSPGMGTWLHRRVSGRGYSVGHLAIAGIAALMVGAGGMLGGLRGCGYESFCREDIERAEAAQAEVTRLEGDNQSLTDKVKDLTKELSTSEGNNKTLTEANGELSSQITGYEEQVAGCETGLGSCQSELDALKPGLANLKRQHGICQTESERYRKRADQCEMNLKGCRDDYREFEAVLESWAIMAITSARCCKERGGTIPPEMYTKLTPDQQRELDAVTPGVCGPSGGYMLRTPLNLGGSR